MSSVTTRAVRRAADGSSRPTEETRKLANSRRDGLWMRMTESRQITDRFDKRVTAGCACYYMDHVWRELISII